MESSRRSSPSKTWQISIRWSSRRIGSSANWNWSSLKRNWRKWSPSARRRRLRTSLTVLWAKFRHPRTRGFKRRWARSKKSRLKRTVEMWGSSQERTAEKILFAKKVSEGVTTLFGSAWGGGNNCGGMAGGCWNSHISYRDMSSLDRPKRDTITKDVLLTCDIHVPYYICASDNDVFILNPYNSNPSPLTSYYSSRRDYLYPYECIDVE